jgi:secreted trypsin-like serine protease
VGGDGQIIHINDIEHGYASSYGFTSRSVRRIIPHPEYDFSGAGFRNDIALVEVLQPFSQAYSALLAIPSRSVELSTAPTGTLAVAVGYGLKEDNQWNDGMRSVEIELLQPQDCRNRFVLESEIAVVHEDTLCAGKTGQGINSGDSGGPLLVSRSGGGSLSWLQVGVASMRARDASGTPGPSVYTRVSGYAEWIAQTTKQDGSPTPQQRTAAYMLQVTSLLRVNQNNIRALERERDQLLRSLFGLLDQYLATPDQ